MHMRHRAFVPKRGEKRADHFPVLFLHADLFAYRAERFFKVLGLSHCRYLSVLFRKYYITSISLCHLFYDRTEPFRDPLRLPLALPCDACGFGSLGAIPRGAEGVTVHMRGRHCLPCGTSGKTSCAILGRCAGSRMGCKRIPSHVSHLEHTRTCPCTTCFDSFARSIIFRIFFLKVRKHMLGAIRCPERQRLLVVLAWLRSFPFFCFRWHIRKSISFSLLVPYAA